MKNFILLLFMLVALAAMSTNSGEEKPNKVVDCERVRVAACGNVR